MRIRQIACVLVLLLAAQLPLAAQTTSAGSITGTVIDSTGAVVPGAAVTATNVDRNTSVKTVTNEAGIFVFTDLAPATYTVTVEKAGFRKYEQRDVVLNVNNRLALGNITMEVGTVAQTVQVVGQGLRLQTESAERAGVIVGTQIDNILIHGRSPLDLLRILPGVVSTFDTTLANNQIQNISINGGRQTSLNATLDGISNLDTGSNTKLYATLSPDSLQEFKVLSSNYQAQYGKAAGGTIMYVTKSGTKDFHGSAYWYYRDKSMNANTWINNRDRAPNPITGKAPKDPFHYNYLGYTIGGPIYIPGRFNTNKDKLFFFWSEEYQRQLIPGSLERLTIPTALEASGDFSQSVTKNTAYGGTPDAEYIHNPSLPPDHCKAGDTANCFQDGGVVGRIPAASQYAPGIALLKWLKSTADAGSGSYVTGQKGYNYQWTPVASEPRHERLMRIDSNLSQSWRVFGSFTQLVQDAEMGDYVGKTWTYSLNPNFPLKGGAQYKHPGYVLSVNLTTTINPTSTNEVIFGIGHHPVTVLPGDPTALTRAGTGVYLNTFFAPYADWIPRFSFTGTKLANTPQLQPGGGAMAPFNTYNTVLEMADNYTKVWNKHLIKAGIYLQRNRKNQTAYVQSGGTYTFDDSSSNPYDTGFGFANAAAGVYTQFSQASNFLTGQYRYTNLEMYIQDTMKVSRRLTLDLGLRAYLVQPTFDQALQTSTFWPSKYDPSQAVQFLWPCWNPAPGYSGKWACEYPNLGVGQTPQTPGANLSGMTVYTPGTGTAAESALDIGKIVPSVGSLTDGILPAGQGINKYLMQFPGIRWAPRVGFAIDLTGHGNLVLRAGAGAYYDRYQGNEIFNVIVNPPAIFNPTVVNGFASSLTLAGALLSPGGLTVISPDGEVPLDYNYSGGIQAKLPWATILDVSYVGLLGRQLLYNTNINAAPYGAAFLQQNQDPTKWGGNVPTCTADPSTSPCTGSNAYDSNFLRPFRGYGDITLEHFGATSNYNSLQVTVDRRFAKGAFLGVAYTWGKCLTMADNDGAGGRIDNLTKLADYGPCGYDVRQTFATNYVYKLPGVTGHGSLDNMFTRALLNGWQLSGVTTFANGTPLTPGYSISGVSNANLTGTGAFGSRVKLVGNPLSSTSSAPYDRLNAAAFLPPTRPSLGLESGVNYIVQPGINDWDLSLQKNFPVKERAHLEFRVDAFNVFNHTQFNGLNATLNYGSYGSTTPTNLPYNASGVLVNKTGFGTVSGVRYPRILQLVARFVF
jgi:hypothetical protein